MTHVQRRKAEIEAARQKVLTRKPPKKRTRRLSIAPTDADALRFIAQHLRKMGLMNFSAELERIANVAVIVDSENQQCTSGDKP